MTPEQILAELGVQNVLGFILAPLFSSKLLPARARGIVAVGLALGIAPIAMNAGGENIPTEVLALGGLVLKEMLVGLVLGLVVSVFQAVTQIQEQTLTFIPKIIGLAVVLIVLGPWMLGVILSWTAELYGQIPELVGA